MFLGDPRALTVRGLTISRAPERIWQPHFTNPEPLPEVARLGLVRHVLELDERWIAIDGAPGMGRTTLLGQVADEFLIRGEWFHAIWTTRQLHESYGFSRHQRTRDLRPLQRWLRLQARESASGTLTLMIDDYDTLLNQEFKCLLEELLLALPQLRVITTSVEPLVVSASLSARGIERVGRVAATELLFSYEETEEFISAVVSTTGPASALTSAELRHKIFERTAGVPLGVALALDRISRSDEWPDYQLTQVMNSFYTNLLRTHTQSMNRQGLSAMHSRLSLMPRFSNVHLLACFPEASPEMLQAFAESPALDGRKRVRPGEYAWCEDFQFAAKELNAIRVNERRELAAELYRANYAGGAFEQWFLAKDLARAEAMLRARFLTVFETLSPETAQEVCAISPQALAPYPMIRVMQMLLDPRATAMELRQCIENLGILGARGGATGLLSLAVRAAVLARQGLAKAAYEQAELVLEAAAGLLLEEHEETAAERRSAVEASLTAALTLFEIGSRPSRLAVIPRGHGSPFLRYRRDLAQQFLDQVRAEPLEGSLVAQRVVPHSYRALVFSDAACSSGIEAIVTHDQRFANELQGIAANTLQSLPVGQHTFVPLRSLSVTDECLHLLVLDDQTGAVEVAFRPDLVEPQASFLRALVLLTTGRDREAREVLDGMIDGGGARSEATRSVLRACVLARLGLSEAARAALSRAENLPASVVVQAFTFVRPDDARALVELRPDFGRFERAAARLGVLGSGRTLETRRRFQTLTEKERTVLLDLREGLNTRQIAERHYLSVNTVRTHVRSIGKKLDASGQAEMLRRAEELRIFPAQ